MIDILEEAAEIISGKRQEEYGSPEDSFYKIACLWSAYLDYEVYVTPKDVAMMMVLLKVARAPKNGDATRDTYVDIAGYAALGASVQAEP